MILVGLSISDLAIGRNDCDGIRDSLPVEQRKQSRYFLRVDDCVGSNTSMDCKAL
jgi:hypothetical protein